MSTLTPPFPTGNIAAVVTPFRNVRYDVDLFAIEKHSSYLFDKCNISGVVVGGHNGEGSSFGEPQFESALTAANAIKQLHPTKTVYIGIMARTADQAQERIQIANERTIDGFLLAPPLVEVLGNDTAAIKFYATAGELCDKPIIAYNTLQSATPLTADALRHVKKIVGNRFIGVKNSGSDQFFNEFCIQTNYEPATYQYIEGNDRRIGSSLTKLHDLNGQDKYQLPFTTISGSSNWSVCAKLIGRIHDAALLHHHRDVMRMQSNLDANLEAVLRNAKQFGGEAPIWKALAVMDGNTMNLDVMPPLVQIDDDEIQRLIDYTNTE